MLWQPNRGACAVVPPNRPRDDYVPVGLGRWLSVASCGLHLPEPWLVESYTTVIIPFDDGVIFVCLLNRAEFSIRLSEVAQTLDAISRIQFLVGGRGLGERWPFGTVGVRSRPCV